MNKTQVSEESVKSATTQKSEPKLNLRYKLSDPEFIFGDKCSPETCVDPNLMAHSIASILNEVMSGLKLNQRQNGLRGAAQAFEPSGTSISPELKRQEFMAYLRHSGFITEISKVLLALYEMEQLPSKKEAVEFICRAMGYGLTSQLERPAAGAYKEKLQKQIEKYKKQRDHLRLIFDTFRATPAKMDWVNRAKLPPIKLIKAPGEVVDPEVTQELPPVQEKPVDQTKIASRPSHRPDHDLGGHRRHHYPRPAGITASTSLTALHKFNRRGRRLTRQ